MTTQSYRTDSQSQVPAFAMLQANADGTTSLIPGSSAASPGFSQLSVTGAAVSSGNPLPVYESVPPSLNTGTGLVPAQTTVAAGSLIAKASAGLLYGAYCTSTVAGWLLVFNSVTVPADGTVTPVHAIPVAAGGVAALPAGHLPEFMATGITLVFSTTGPYTKTISATAFIHAYFK